VLRLGTVLVARRSLSTFVVLRFFHCNSRELRPAIHVFCDASLFSLVRGPFAKEKTRAHGAGPQRPNTKGDRGYALKQAERFRTQTHGREYRNALTERSSHAFTPPGIRSLGGNSLHCGNSLPRGASPSAIALGPPKPCEFSPWWKFA
jgi:hypothetical protein